MSDQVVRGYPLSCGHAVLLPGVVLPGPMWCTRCEQPAVLLAPPDAHEAACDRWKAANRDLINARRRARHARKHTPPATAA